MLDLIVLNAAACANGQCPQTQQALTVIQQPAVVAVASAVPGKTVVKYRRNIFGRLIPVYAEVTATVAATATASGNCAGGKCK